jgi:hypothetical protein
MSEITIQPEVSVTSIPLKPKLGRPRKPFNELSLIGQIMRPYQDKYVDSRREKKKEYEEKNRQRTRNYENSRYASDPEYRKRKLLANSRNAIERKLKAEKAAQISSM